MTQHRCANGQQEERNNASRSALELYILIYAAGLLIFNKQAHYHRWDQEVNQRRNKQDKELLEFNQTGLPYHQRCNIAKRTKSTACVCCDHNIDTSKVNKAFVAFGYFSDDGTH